MANWVLIAALGILLVVTYWRSRSVLYPPFTFTALWMMVVLVYQANLIVINPLHSGTCLLVGLGVFAFSLGGELALAIPEPLLQFRFVLAKGMSSPPVRRMYLWKMLMLAAGLAGMLRIAQATISAGLGGAGGILASARTAGLAETQDAGIGGILAAYVSIWVNCTAVMFFIERRDRWFYIAGFTALVSAIFTTSRGPVLELFVMLATAHLIQTDRLKLNAAWKFVRIPILTFLLLYVGLTFTIKDTSTLEGGIFGVITYFVVGYMIGPLAAMDYVLQHPAEYAADPHHTFKFFLKLGSSLHLWSYTSPPLFDQFLEVPFPTNVYTGFKFFYTDFGFVGCIIVVGIIGFLQALLYRKARMKSTLALYLFTFLTFVLVMFIFDDLYTATGQILCVLTFGVLYQACRGLRILPESPTPLGRFTLLPSQLKLRIFANKGA